MTLRALLIGLILGLVIAATGYFNDRVLNQTFLAGDLIPVSVYGLLVIGLLLVNPLLRFVKRLNFSAPEWAVIVSLMMVICVIPGPGLMWQFSHAVVLPHMYEKYEAGWRENKLLSYVPPIMLVDPGDDYETVVAGFKVGLRRDKDIPVTSVPWGAWTRTLSFYLPLLGLSFIAGICIVLVVHRQWSHRERLRYPIADFASQLVAGSEKGAFPSIFHNRRFWMGFLPVVLVLLVNGYNTYNPESIKIPLTVNLSGFAQKFPSLRQVDHVTDLIKPSLCFAAVGFAYFVSSEVSFSIGIGHVLYAAVFLAMLRMGVDDLKGDYLGGGKWNFSLFGAYLGTGLVTLYLGRRFYGAVILRALGIRVREHVQRSEVWACRIALLAAVAMVIMLRVFTGLNLLYSGLFVMLTGLLFLIVTRINVETGLFFVQPTWHAVGVILGIFGAGYLGAEALIVLGLLCVVMTIDPRVCLMPLVANALRFSENTGVRPYRLSKWLVLAVLLGLIVGVFATIYVQYDHGGAGYSWATQKVPKLAFNLLARNLPKIRQSAGAIKVNRELVRAAAVGMGLVLACSWFRLRYTWWPIHPVLFLVWGTFTMGVFAPSFLIGWIIKVAVTRFGGGDTYRKCKPLFIGMIAGEFVAGIFWMIVALIYYKVAGPGGPLFRVHP